MSAVNANQYDEISDDEISGFANTTKIPTTKFLTIKPEVVMIPNVSRLLILNSLFYNIHVKLFFWSNKNFGLSSAKQTNDCIRHTSALKMKKKFTYLEER